MEQLGNQPDTAEKLGNPQDTTEELGAEELGNQQDTAENSATLDACLYACLAREFSVFYDFHDSRIL